jgi:hypothetical protein
MYYTMWVISKQEKVIFTWDNDVITVRYIPVNLYLCHIMYIIKMKRKKYHSDTVVTVLKYHSDTVVTVLKYHSDTVITVLKYHSDTVVTLTVLKFNQRIMLYRGALYRQWFVI